MGLKKITYLIVWFIFNVGLVIATAERSGSRPFGWQGIAGTLMVLTMLAAYAIIFVQVNVIICLMCYVYYGRRPMEKYRLLMPLTINLTGIFMHGYQVAQAYIESALSGMADYGYAGVYYRRANDHGACSGLYLLIRPGIGQVKQLFSSVHGRGSDYGLYMLPATSNFLLSLRLWCAAMILTFGPGGKKAKAAAG